MAAIVAIAFGALAVAGYLILRGSEPTDAVESTAGELVSPLGQPRSGDEAAAFVRQLEAHVARKPRDARAWVILARTRAAGNDFAAAVDAYERAIAASTKVARDPQVLSELADALGMANGGVLAGRPRELAEQALALDASHPKALDLAGSAAYEAGDYRGALLHWQKLLATLDLRSQEHAELATAIERTRRRAEMQP